MDLVLNHTSDKHPWFIESSSSRTQSQGRLVYVAATRSGEDTAIANPPNNWESLFGGSAWQWDAARQQYYYHRFYIQQPDLNLRNPKVAKAMYDVEALLDPTRRRRLSPRCDHISSSRTPGLRDEHDISDQMANAGPQRLWRSGSTTSHTDNLAGVHGILARATPGPMVAGGIRRKVVLIGETYVSSWRELRKMYGASNDELQLPMDIQVGFHRQVRFTLFRKRINDAETGIDGEEPLFVFDNHDNARWDRYRAARRELRISATVPITTRSGA